MTKALALLMFYLQAHFYTVPVQELKPLVSSSASGSTNTSKNRQTPISSSISADDDYSVIQLTDNITLKVKKRSDYLTVGAYGKENSGFKDVEMELPYYTGVSSGWQKKRYSQGIYGIWAGCYPHFCGSQRGAVIFDSVTQRFYRIQFVEASTREDREEERNTLDGKSLSDGVNYINFPLGRLPDELLLSVLSDLNFEKAEIVEGRLCSKYYCDGGKQPPSSRNQGSIEELQRSLALYGLAWKMPYAQARQILIKQNWKPEGKGTQFKFPEVSCGNAVCGASFVKGKLRLNVSLSFKLEVQGAYETLITD